MMLMIFAGAVISSVLNVTIVPTNSITYRLYDSFAITDCVCANHTRWDGQRETGPINTPLRAACRCMTLGLNGLLSSVHLMYAIAV
jgi:hypothetical protein